MYPHDNIFNIYYNIGKRTPFLVKRCELGSVRSSSETIRIDPNQDTTFLVESVIPRGKYGKAYGKCFVEIYKIDSQYLHWLETTDRLFRIDFDKLKELCPDAENSINKSVGENN